MTHYRAYFHSALVRGLFWACPLSVYSAFLRPLFLPCQLSVYSAFFASSFSALSTWFSCASPVFTVPPVTQHKSCQVSYIMSHGNDRIEYMENIKRNVIL